MVVVRFVLLLLFGFAFANQESEDSNPCTTFQGKPGNCIRVRHCPRIRRIFKKRNKTAEDYNFLSNVGCPAPDTEECKNNLENRNCAYVCCEVEGLNQLNDTDNFDTCGLFSDNKIMGGREVAVHSRPWMALLKFALPQGTQFLCGGSLITKRFVLTAAHCDSTEHAKLIQVRLGEHSISETRYCLNNHCEQGHMDYDVDKFIAHDDFDKQTGRNDIALVKLAKDVEYNDHIRPICLPISPELKEIARNQKTFHVLGWGATETRSHSDVLLETLLHRTTCSIPRPTQICAGLGHNDTCNGDSGGPLIHPSVYYDMQRFVQFGIVSYGPIFCGLGTPAIYTNVAEYITWIAAKMML